MASQYTTVGVTVMASLFSGDLEAQRDRLRELGYVHHGRTRQGVPLWLEPDGLCSVEEPVALRQLAAREISTSSARAAHVPCDRED
jgi:hypothetical protein